MSQHREESLSTLDVDGGRKVSRRQFLRDSGIVLGSLLLGERLSHGPDDGCGAFSFVHMSDPHIGHHPGADETFRRALEGVERLRPRPRFILVTGDLTEGEVDQYRTFREIASRTTLPLHVLPGNHDIGNRMSERSLRLLDRYRRELGPDYYAFSVGRPDQGVLFIMLNSLFLRGRSKVFHRGVRRSRAEAAAQWDFLKGELKHSAAGAHPARNVFVCFHHLPYSVHPRGPGGGYLPISRAARRRIFTLCEEYRVQAVLTGHAHWSRSDRYNGTALITTPSVSFNSPFGPGGKLPLGYRVITVDRGGLTHRYKSIDTTGLERFWVIGLRQRHSDGGYVADLDGTVANPRGPLPILSGRGLGVPEGHVASA